MLVTFDPQTASMNWKVIAPQVMGRGVGPVSYDG